MHPNDGRVVSNFIVQALLGRGITVYGDGMQTRASCYVNELVDGLIRLMKSEDEVTGPINLGNPEEFTMLELAAAVIDLAGSRVVHRPLPEDDPRRARPDISKAQAILQCEPRTQFKEGLKKTIAYFEELLKVPNVREMLNVSK